MQDNTDKNQHASRQRSTRADDDLQRAIAERERLLERQPHLRTYQAEIDRILDKSGNRQGRMAVLGTLMQGKLLDMQRELFKLTETLQQTLDAK